jgi:hypothetical protein
MAAMAAAVLSASLVLAPLSFFDANDDVLNLIFAHFSAREIAATIQRVNVRFYW